MAGGISSMSAKTKVVADGSSDPTLHLLDFIQLTRGGSIR